MYVKRDVDFWELENDCWSGAENTLAKICEHDLEDEFMDWLESYFGDEVPTMTEVNDLLRFDDEFVFESIGLFEEEDEDEYWDEDEEEEEESDFES